MAAFHAFSSLWWTVGSWWPRGALFEWLTSHIYIIPPFSLFQVSVKSAFGSSTRKQTMDDLCSVWRWNLYFFSTLKKKSWFWLAELKTNHIFPWANSCSWRRGTVCKHGQEEPGGSSLSVSHAVRSCTPRFGDPFWALKCQRDRIQMRARD